ncbi:MAG TPA: GIY-YIG nuclease family protein [Candidatus Limnocylindria bacterium]|nr:GIY-YIG nuclease family protein [Candidatus Limnocylindria bacterium]
MRELLTENRLVVAFGHMDLGAVADPLVNWGTAEIGPHVYGIVGAGRVKIGISLQVKARMDTFRVGCPVPLELRWLFPGWRQLELALHNELADHRAFGEWFALNDVVTRVLDREQTKAPEAIEIARLRSLYLRPANDFDRSALLRTRNASGPANAREAA